MDDQGRLNCIVRTSAVTFLQDMIGLKEELGIFMRKNLLLGKFITP